MRCSLQQPCLVDKSPCQGSSLGVVYQQSRASGCKHQALRPPAASTAPRWDEVWFVEGLSQATVRDALASSSSICPSALSLQEVEIRCVCYTYVHHVCEWHSRCHGPQWKGWKENTRTKRPRTGIREAQKEDLTSSPSPGFAATPCTRIKYSLFSKCHYSHCIHWMFETTFIVLPQPLSPSAFLIPVVPLFQPTWKLRHSPRLRPDCRSSSGSLFCECL